jgi:uncharacterized protein (DUF362 family)
MKRDVSPGEADMKKIDRRVFIKATAAAGAAAVLGGPALTRSARAGEKSIVASARGDDYFAAAVRAVEELGGMEKYVSRGDTVGLLVNCPFRNHGASVNPAVTLAAAEMVRRAGASEIIMIKEAGWGYWNRSPLTGRYKDLIRSFRPGGDHRRTEIKGGRVLHEAMIARGLLDCDVFINIPIFKHHRGVNYTGALKNMMGACPYSPTNKFIHSGDDGWGWYGNLEHMNQAIADLNLVRRPDLVVADGTEFITTNGPWGPGRLVKARRAAASEDPAAVDAYGIGLIGRSVSDAPMIAAAAAHGLGRADPGGITIKEVEV